MFVENNEEEIVDSAETTITDDVSDNDTENASNTEDEVAKTTESSKQQSDKTGETTEQRRARIKRQYEREFGKQDSKGSKEGSEEKEVGSDERYQRLELKTEGITSKKAQDVVLEYAKWKGIDPVDALKSPIVKAEIADLEKKTSAPPPSKRTTAGATDSFEYWVSQAKKGNFPRGDKAMMDKLKKARIFTS
jgi:hypothetical protein